MIVRAVAAAYLAVLAGKAVAALRAAGRAPEARVPGPAERSRTVVAQPVLSGDPDLAAALADNLCELAGVRFCWLVDEDDPEGRSICADLADDRVEVIVCPPAPDGVNPKLFKLQRALDRCTDADVLVVLDDDTRLPAASLGALLGGLSGGDGPTVVTGLPAYLPGRNTWSRLVGQFVNSNAALTYLPTAPVTLNGMTYALLARDLRLLGGFTPIQRCLTDDLAVAGLVTGRGGRIVQTASPQWITTGVPGPRAYAQLMHRWFLFATILLRRQPPSTVLTVSGLHGVPPMLLWWVLAGAARAGRPWLAAAVLAVRALVLVAVQRRIYGHPLHRPVLSVAAELAQPIHLAHACVRRTIVWRTRRYRVVDDTDFRPVP